MHLLYAFLEHKGYFNEPAGTQFYVTPAFSSSSVTELPENFPSCDLHGKCSFSGVGFALCGTSHLDGLSAGMGAITGSHLHVVPGAELFASSS